MEAVLRARMAKITSKYQVTVPRTIADQYHIRPGDDIAWLPAGEVIRVLPPGKPAAGDNLESALRLFDQATQRHRKRPSVAKAQQPRNRGWKREDLYKRGRAR